MLLVSIFVLMLAVALGIFANQQQTPPPFTTSQCADDPPLTIVGTTQIEPCHVFSQTYEEARTKFRHAATKVGAELHQLEVEVPPQKKFSKDYQYTIDVAIMNKGNATTTSGLVVHTSGVHGVEGYAGSSIQIAFLESIYTDLIEEKSNNEQQSSLPTIVLVHAVNPYGMAHYRRTNENNVDLNRNGLHLEEWQTTNTVDATGIYEAYGKLHGCFNPKGPPNWLYALVTFWTEAAQQLATQGFYGVKAAMVTGQYYDNEGIFFGGQELQPSLQLLWDFFQNNLLLVSRAQDTGSEEEVAEEGEASEVAAAATPKSSCCSGPVTWIDVHTGLGPSGVDSILFDEDTMKKDGKFLQEQVELWFPGAQIPHLSETAKNVIKGYDNAKGCTRKFFQRLWSDNSSSNQQHQENQYLGMVQEFGTVPGFLVAHALILENRAYHHLPIKDALEWSNRTTKRAFYKQTPKWRKQILERGTQLLLQAIQRSSSSSS